MLAGAAGIEHEVRTGLKGDALREAIAQVPPTTRAAVGPTRRGISGFRRTHAAALAIQRRDVGFIHDREVHGCVNGV